MTKKIILQDSFLISGVMCYQGCGVGIQNRLHDIIDDLKKQRLLPEDAQLSIDAEPENLGIHRLIITLEIEEDEDTPPMDLERLKKELREAVDLVNPILDGNEKNKQESNKIHWINIAVNLLALALIIGLSIALPPSLPLTIGLTVFSFLITAFTARKYLIAFFKNLREKTIMTMATPITLGWFLSLAHTLYHSIMMPMATSFSMAFMSFAMPVMLITFINGMDEIKRLVLNQSSKMHLKGMKSLFPEMAETYACYQLSSEEESRLSQGQIDVLSNDKIIQQRKNALKKGMYILIRRGECFPVDGMVIQGNTLIDASLLTGEPRLSTQIGDKVPAGAINLGQDIIISASEDCYNSTVNRLLFRANRGMDENAQEKSHRLFIYLYTTLILLGIAAAIVTPFALGIFTVPLLLQNVTGILFSICPCTLAIAHQLPALLSNYQRHKKGIILRDGRLSQHFEAMETIVFDKTGTLTTGESDVVGSEGISDSLWKRIYLLEKHNGAGHPLAMAITRHCEKQGLQHSLIKDVREVAVDFKNRGLSAMVQGRQLQIGNMAYLQESGVQFPEPLPEIIQQQLAQGFTPVYIAEEGDYKGVIFIRHQIRKDVLSHLQRLKQAGKKIIMLTGDSQQAAIGFNSQYGSLFEQKDIHAEQTPEGKEAFLSQLMGASNINPKTVWFVGDGLNDAACARIVSEKGGVSCSMTSNDKSSFFTDLSLNGSLDYLFEHRKLNSFLKKNTRQNQMLMGYSTVIFLAFIIAFSITGIAVSPLIPLMVMLSTTLIVLFNSYRVSLAVDVALDKNPSWLKSLMASDFSLILLLAGGTLFMAAILIATLASGGLALPAMVFTAGAAAAISSSCLIAAAAMLGLFVLLSTAYILTEKCLAKDVDVIEPGLESQVEEGDYAFREAEVEELPMENRNWFFELSRSSDPRKVECTEDHGAILGL